MVMKMENYDEGKGKRYRTIMIPGKDPTEDKKGFFEVYLSEVYKLLPEDIRQNLTEKPAYEVFITYDEKTPLGQLIFTTKSKRDLTSVALDVLKDKKTEQKSLLFYKDWDIVAQEIIREFQ